MIQTIGTAVETQYGGCIVNTVRPPEENLSNAVTVLWNDRRLISPEQRRKAWALIGEISAFVGESREEANGDLKREFLLTKFDELTASAIRTFSLANTDMTTARLYITFLIEFCVEHGVPTRVCLIDLCDDVQAYLYACLMNKKCAVCGLPCDLHHCEGSTVGMGRSRNDIVHLGLEVIPLCRTHHQECHQMGQARFNAKYHLPGGIIADEKICKKYKLRSEAK